MDNKRKNPKILSDIIMKSINGPVFGMYGLHALGTTQHAPIQYIFTITEKKENLSFVMSVKQEISAKFRNNR